ncbi:MAG: class I SAM-dependent rRNA methyltransferase [Anaerolineae bacterium]|nr:class I SAM-dependent rRNA methyltransferase [Anaerolineae bacterium]
MSDIILHKGREKSVFRRHPWIFSGGIARVNGNPQGGDMVTVRADNGGFLARGYWNARSQIQVRILTWEDEPIDMVWWRKMFMRAIDGRKHITSNAYRLINAESDFLAGLIVDKYGDWLVLQALTLAIDILKKDLAHLLMELTGARGVYERSDVDVRGKEGLKPSMGVLAGEAPPKRIIIDEGVQLAVDVYGGHKTGTYLDQRQNRMLVGELIRTQPHLTDVLNVFSYTGGFSVHALQHPQVHAVNIDASADVLANARENMRLNGLDESRAEYIQADVFDDLRTRMIANELYDVVILDPPKFAHAQAQVEKAARGYKDINLNAFKLVKSGGYLFTFSCSGAINADLFQKIVFGALEDSRREAQVIRVLGASDDHPVALSFPEGAYLKGLMLRVY